MNETYVKHLQGMIKIPTISHADASKVDLNAFRELHAYLEETYPNIHRVMQKQVIGPASLLYKWKGKSSEKLPVLLMGHQDVVPVGDLAKWTYPPFSGEIADGCLWGRGTTDCKHVIWAQMETVEELIRDGFVPDYDLYLAYGWNEEVQAPVKGAQEIVSYLKGQGIKLGCVFDEGSGIRKGKIQGTDGYICEVELGEKAFQDYEIYMDCDGGHAMEPGQGTALGAVARAIVAIEDNPFPYRLTPLVENQLKALSVFKTGKEAEIWAEPSAHWEELCALARTDKKLDSLLHTTCAVTMASASSQSNVLPDHVSVIMNCRLLTGDTSEDLLAHFRKLLPENVKIRKLVGDDPEPATSVDGEPYRMIEKIAKQNYGENVRMIPALLAGGTDARYYTAVCDNVFRHTGFLRNEKWGSAHQANERIPCDCLESAMLFYKKLLTQY